MTQTYIPGKDAALEDSIARFQQKLLDLGFDIEEASWLNPVPNVWSVHIRDKACSLCFTNGKGATKKAALASALSVAARGELEAGRLARLGEGEEGPVPGWFCIAMGKHGAYELNYSSDIDISVFYEPEVLPLADGIEMYRCAESRKKLATTPRTEGVRAGKRPSWLTMLKAVE